MALRRRSKKKKPLTTDENNFSNSTVRVCFLGKRVDSFFTATTKQKCLGRFGVVALAFTCGVFGFFT